MDWSKIAPKRADWEKLSEIFAEAGLPRPSWRNGIPEWSTQVDQKLVEQIAGDFQTSGITTQQKSVASPAPLVPKKKGWPKGKPRKK